MIRITLLVVSLVGMAAVAQTTTPNIILMPRTTAPAVRRVAPPVRPVFKLSRDEQALFDLVNSARVKDKLSTLKLNVTLCKIARKHTENMCRQGKMTHVLDGKSVGQRTTEGGYTFSSVRENLAYAASSDPMATSPSPQEIHDRWMASPGHRANILDGKVTEMGLSMMRSSTGVYYYTQVFASPLR